MRQGCICLDNPVVDCTHTATAGYKQQLAMMEDEKQPEIFWRHCTSKPAIKQQMIGTGNDCCCQVIQFYFLRSLAHHACENVTSHYHVICYASFDCSLLSEVTVWHHDSRVFSRVFSANKQRCCREVFVVVTLCNLCLKRVVLPYLTGWVK